MTNILTEFSAVTRAYEIALIGGYTIQIVFDKDYKNGFDDYEQIKKTFKNVKFVEDGDLIVHIHKPNEINSKVFETLEDIYLRVDRVKNNKIPTELTPQALTIINKSINRLDLSIKQTANAIRIASTIAQMCGNTLVQVEHIAEAIFCIHFDNWLCNAENKSISFGGIIIPKYELEPDDIKGAIEYLQSL